MAHLASHPHNRLSLAVRQDHMDAHYLPRSRTKLHSGPFVVLFNCMLVLLGTAVLENTAAIPNNPTKR